MQLVPARWADVEFGVYLADPQDQPWKVVATKDGWTKAVNRAGDERVFPPLPPDTPIRMYVPTSEEAMATLLGALGEGTRVYEE